MTPRAVHLPPPPTARAKAVSKTIKTDMPPPAVKPDMPPPTVKPDMPTAKPVENRSTINPDGPPVAVDQAAGRALLKVLEHGAGPDIDIAWPAAAAERTRLFKIMTRCYGLSLALMDDGSRLYRLADPPGRVWTPNLDQFSGFVRVAKGGQSLEERAAAAKLRRKHPGLTSVSTVRLFPRRVDGALLGGLAQLAGGNAARLKTVRARYRLDGLRLLVGDWRLDGRKAAGWVDLSAQARCRGGRS